MFMFHGLDRAKRLEARQMFIPKGARLIPGPAGCAVYVYETADKPYAIMFRGSAVKSEQHTIYRTIQQRDADIARFFESVRQSQDYKSKRAAEKKAWANPAKVGDILVSSWGYDQTNVDFYAVTKVSGKRVWIRAIMQDSESIGYMQERCWPAMPIQFVEQKGEPDGDSLSRLLRGHETMHIAHQSGENGYSVKVGHHSATLENGRTHYSSSYA